MATQGARGETTLQVGDREIRVLLTNRALASAEKAMGNSTLALIRSQSPTINEIAVLLMAGMQAAKNETKEGGRGRDDERRLGSHGRTRVCRVGHAYLGGGHDRPGPWSRGRARTRNRPKRLDQGSVDFDGLLDECLKLGVSVTEFWDMTPNETYRLIVNRSRHEQDAQKSIAWMTASLTNAKKLPNYKRWMEPPKVVTKKELARRAKEHAEIVARIEELRHGR